MHLADQRRLHERFRDQGQIILAIDGLQPDAGREVLWVLRDCFSGEVLLARSLYLPEAAKPLYEADRHAKKELKKQLRGIRPIERTIEWRSDAEAEAIRGYCLAVRSALADDGKPPLGVPGLKLHTRISAIAASLTRVSEKGACRVRRERMRTFLTKGLTSTASLWADVEQGYVWVHRAAHLLSHDQKQTTAEVRRAYENLLAEMEQAPIPSEPLAAMLSTFRPRHRQLLARPLSLLRSA